MGEELNLEETLGVESLDHHGEMSHLFSSAWKESSRVQLLTLGSAPFISGSDRIK